MRKIVHKNTGSFRSWFYDELGPERIAELRKFLDDHSNERIRIEGYVNDDDSEVTLQAFVEQEENDDEYKFRIDREYEMNKSNLAHYQKVLVDIAKKIDEYEGKGEN